MSEIKVGFSHQTTNYRWQPIHIRHDRLLPAVLYKGHYIAHVELPEITVKEDLNGNVPDHIAGIHTNSKMTWPLTPWTSFSLKVQHFMMSSVQYLF